jgi:hypothetical protein
MENESIGKRGMGIHYKGSQGQTKRAVVLQEEEEFTSQEKYSPAPTEEQARWVTEQGWDILKLSYNSLVI